MRKFIAKILLAVFILNCIPSFGLNEMTLQAAGPGPFGLFARFDRNLKKTNGSSYPLLNVTSLDVPEGYMMAEFNLNNSAVEVTNLSDTTGGVTFTYLQDANTKIQFTIRYLKNAEEYYIYFDPYTYNTVTSSWDWQSNDSMQLWDSPGSFFPVGSFTVPSFPPNTTPRYNVGENVTGIPAHGYYFMATRDAGFTISYGGYEYSFFIDGANSAGNNDTFLFTTNGAKSGRIYNFYLYNYGGTVTLQDHAQGSTGLNTDTLDYIPFAEPYVTSSTYPGSSAAGDYLNGHTTQAKFINNKYELQYPGELPSTQPGLAIRFDEPVEYMLLGDAINGAPALQPISNFSGGTSPYSIEANFHMNDDIENANPGGYNIISARVNDFHLVSTAGRTLDGITGSDKSTPHPSSSVRKMYVHSAPLPARYEIRLLGLLPNQLFHNVHLDMDIKSSRSTFAANYELPKTPAPVLPLGTAFTFLDYRFRFVDGEYELHLTPYGTAGTYFMQANSTTYVASSSGANGNTVIFNIPYRSDYTYAIYFFPGMIGAQPGNVNFDEGVYSEKTRYTPDPSDWEMGSPKQFKVVEHDLKALPDSFSNNYGYEGLLDMTVRWSLAVAADIQNYITSSGGSPVTFNYQVNKALFQDKDIALPFADVDITIRPDGSGGYEWSYTYTLADGGATKTSPYTTFTAANNGLDNGYYYVTIEFEDIPAERAVNDVTGEETDPKFYYPRIYFINAAFIGVTPIKHSTFDSITLDDLLQAQLPPLKNLRNNAANTAQTSFEAQFTVPSAEIQRYLDETPLFDNREFHVNFYISQNEPLMHSFAEYTTRDDRHANSSSYAFSSVDDGSGNMDFDMNPAIINELRQNNSIIRVNELPLYDSAGRAAWFTKIAAGADYDETWTLLGLDPNQKYYIYVTLETDYTYTDTSSAVIPATDESRLSNLHGVTTTDDPDVPGGNDWRPPAPVLDVKDIGVDTATVYWDYAGQPDTTASYTEEYYYEVIRTKNDPMASSHMNSYKDLSDIYAALYTEMAGIELAFFRTDDTLNADGKYSPYIFDGTNYTKASSDLYELMFGDQTLEFIDRNLNANQIYFYYVRTVRVVDGTPIYSVWNYTNCTTSTLGSPINLMIDYDASFDTKSEVVLAFDAPFTNIDQLGTEYELEYAIKKDIEDFGDPIVFNTTTLKQNYSAAEADGYFHFSYKISGLEQGTQYSFRVRMKAINSADRSPWSNVVSTRTGIEEGTAENNRTADAWMEFYRQQLEALHKNDYWPTQDNKTNFSAVYRPTMFQQVIGKTADSQILLPTGTYEEAYIFTYYVSADSMKKANEANKGFVLAWHDMEVVIGPGTVSTETNETVFDIAEKLNDKSVKDYYVMFKIEFKEYTTLVNNQEPISDQVVITFELVGSRELTNLWDGNILQMYVERVATEGANQTVRNRILNMLTRNNTAAEVEAYVLERVKTVQEDLIKETYSSHRSNTRYGYTIDTLDKSIIIATMTAAEQHVSANGFRLVSGAWNNIDTFDYKGGKGFYTNLPGTYIFAGVIVKIPGIDGQPNAGTAYTIVSKYSLTDFLGLEGTINVASPATRNMLISSAARMMGAPVGSDPVAFFKSKGYNISGAGLDTVASAQESVYIVMAVYEVKTGTKVNTIQIRNYALTTNIAGMDERYKQSIRAAFELGIYTNTAMQPKVGITIKDLLDMLTALDNRANL